MKVVIVGGVAGGDGGGKNPQTGRKGGDRSI